MYAFSLFVFLNLALVHFGFIYTTVTGSFSIYTVSATARIGGSSSKSFSNGENHEMVVSNVSIAKQLAATQQHPDPPNF